MRLERSTLSSFGSKMVVEMLEARRMNIRGIYIRRTEYCMFPPVFPSEVSVQVRGSAKWR